MGFSPLYIRNKPNAARVMLIFLTVQPLPETLVRPPLMFTHKSSFKVTLITLISASLAPAAPYGCLLQKN
jgi:hypothetical protein